MKNHIKNYPLAGKYDSKLVEENLMGPNALYLLEEVCSHLSLRPGMRVLDMGCGKGLTSIFLAREFRVTVFANDLWIPASENWERFGAANLQDLIVPMHAEAHNLPYAHNFFDAAISIDSYHYYGCDDTYFTEHYAPLVKQGGQFGFAMPGITREIDTNIPEKMQDIWQDKQDAFATFKTSLWWRTHLEKDGLATVETSYDLQNAREIWQEWAVIARKLYDFNDDEMLAADDTNLLTLSIITATKI